MNFLFPFLVTVWLALVTVFIALPSHAAETYEHDITIVPGEPWSMVVQWRYKETAPTANLNNYYLAYVGNGSPLSDGVTARMYIESSTVDATAVLLRLTAKQTAAIAKITDKKQLWSLVHIPDLGPALLVARGEVKL
jgi:hypothetical protein